MNHQKVDFFLVGAARAGTTTLAEYLKLHPEISFANPKEPEFFTQYPDDWEAHLAEYEACFAPPDGRIRGEGSTNYSMHPIRIGVAGRLADYNPNAKIIYILRDPVARTLSMMQRFTRKQNKGALLNQLEDCRRFMHLIFPSCFSAQIRLYQDSFSPDNIHFVHFDELSDPKTQQSVFERTCAFLNVSFQTVTQDPIHTHNSKIDKAINNSLPYKIAQSGVGKALIPMIPMFVRKYYRSNYKVPPKPFCYTIDFQLMLWDLYRADLEYAQQLTGLDFSRTFAKYEALAQLPASERQKIIQR
jgi:hypothetical protein